MKPLLLAVMILLGSADENFWHVLAQVEFQHKKDKNGYDVEVPVFSKYLKSFDGKKVKVKGYIIPMGELGGQDKFMLSALPFNVCYFCGAAGPETVMEVEIRERLKFSTKPIVLQGTLVLNATDPDHHIYILRAAELVP